MSNATFIYVGSYSGTAKESGRSFNRVSIVGKTDNGLRRFDLFTKNGKKLSNQDKLQFGDVVRADYEDSDYPGGRSSLCALEVVSTTPYNLDTMTLIDDVAELLGV